MLGSRNVGWRSHKATVTPTLCPCRLMLDLRLGLAAVSILFFGSILSGCRIHIFGMLWSVDLVPAVIGYEALTSICLDFASSDFGIVTVRTPFWY